MFILRKNKGFTLVELMIVIAIIAVLVSIILIAVNPVRVIHDAQDTKRRTEINQAKTALQLYYNDNKDYPASTALVSSLQPNYWRLVPSVSYYGYKRISSTDYIVGTQLNNPSNDDIATFTKCNGGAAVSNLVSFKDPTVTFNLPTTGGFIVCSD